MGRELLPAQSHLAAYGRSCPSSLTSLGEAPLPKSGEIVGGKTGTTLKAGNCLVLLDRSDAGKPYISIVMGAGTKDVLYQDMTALIEGISDNE